MKLTIIFIAILLTGLSAGLFYSWSVSVIPGTKKISDINYLSTMKSINKEILNPMFFIIFFGPLLTLGISAVQQYTNNSVFWLIFFSGVIFLVGTFGVTAFGNVPMNKQSDSLFIENLSVSELSDWRHYYESLWNKLHIIRTLFSVTSFILVLLAVFKMTEQKI